MADDFPLVPPAGSGFQRADHPKPFGGEQGVQFLKRHANHAPESGEFGPPVYSICRAAFRLLRYHLNRIDPMRLPAQHRGGIPSPTGSRL